MKDIEKKIKTLGGIEVTKHKKSQKTRDQLIRNENPGTLIVDFIDKYGNGMFNNTIVYKSIKKIPMGGKKGWGGIELILGWSNDTSGVKENLERLTDEDIKGYFPFAEGYPGDLVCICTLKGTKNGNIYYWDHDEGKFFHVSRSFKEFVKSWKIDPGDDDDKQKPKLISAWFADDF